MNFKSRINMKNTLMSLLPGEIGRVKNVKEGSAYSKRLMDVNVMELA